MSPIVTADGDRPPRLSPATARLCIFPLGPGDTLLIGLLLAVTEGEEPMTMPASPSFGETPERLRIGEHYYLLASAFAPRRPHVLLNHQDSFAIFDSIGDVPLTVDEPYGSSTVRGT